MPWHEIRLGSNQAILSKRGVDASVTHEYPPLEAGKPAVATMVFKSGETITRRFTHLSEAVLWVRRWSFERGKPVCGRVDKK